MDGNTTKPTHKHTKQKKNTSTDVEPTTTEQDTLLEIKRTLNTTLKDMFGEHDERLAKLESILLAPERTGPKEFPKAPEHCYN